MDSPTGMLASITSYFFVLALCRKRALTLARNSAFSKTLGGGRTSS